MGNKSVYLIHLYESGENHYFKVGISNTPNFRLATFRTVCPFAEVVFHFPGNAEIEYQMLSQLQNCKYRRVHQEVFEVPSLSVKKFVETFLYYSTANGFSDPMNTEKYTGCKVSCYRTPRHIYFHKDCNPETCDSVKLEQVAV